MGDKPTMKTTFIFVSVLIIQTIVPFLYATEPPKFRGAMISPGSFQESDLKVLGEEWNANLIRWQMNWGFPHGKADTATIGEYYSWIDDSCKLLDAMLPSLRSLGIKVCLDLHTSPGGFNEKNINRMFEEKEFADAFVETWCRLANHYKDEETIWGYDILNEPVESAEQAVAGHTSWRELAEHTSRVIREIDPETPIIFEPSNWGGPTHFVDLVPLDIPNVIYSFHMYHPHEFTHQGVFGQISDWKPTVYPGEINGVYWDKTKLREIMAPVLEFQQKYDVPIYVGEFSAIRWAPENSAYRYLNDVIEIFEEYGWDWTYHAFREWSGWSVEHTEDRSNNSPATEPTERELLLRRYFKKNDRTAK